jgi:hypothetical protein
LLVATTGRDRAIGNDLPAKRMMEPLEPSDRTSDGDGTVEFLAELVAEGVDIDGQALHIAPDLWVIHGAIVYGGDSLLAEFDTLEQANSTLERLTDPDRPEEDP